MFACFIPFIINLTTFTSLINIIQSFLHVLYVSVISMHKEDQIPGPPSPFYKKINNNTFKLNTNKLNWAFNRPITPVFIAFIHTHCISAKLFW